MKKQTQKIKGKNSPETNGAESTKLNESLNGRTSRSGEGQLSVEKATRAIQKTPKKPASAGPGVVGRFISKAGHFLREAKVELKKVKWPTRKELLASTAVVIVLTLLLAFFLGLVDFGLIKIIRNVVG